MMMLAVFRSRAHSLDYLERLRSFGISATTMSAPKETRVGCAVCVKFDEKLFPRAQAILKTGKYSSFKGFYRLEFVNGSMKAILYRK